MDRRTFLGGVSGTLAGAALAGCTGILGQSTDASDGTRWLPSPGAISSNEITPEGRYSAVLTSPTSVSNHREVLGTNWESYRSRWLDTEYAFPTASELDVVVGATSEAGGLFRVATGSFNSTRIIERLSDNNFEVASGDSAEYSYYLRDDEQVGYALTDSNLLRAQIPSSLRETDAGTLEEFSLVGLLDTIIESERGAIERYGDDNSDLIPLADQGLSGGSLLYDYHGDRFTDRSFENLDSMAGEFPDHVVTGQGQKLSGETTDVTLVLVFENEETFIQNPLESSIDTYVMESPQFENWREIDWTREERTVIIEGTVRSVEAWPLQQVTVGQDRNANP